jgi:hypothetical protein
VRSLGLNAGSATYQVAVRRVSVWLVSTVTIFISVSRTWSFLACKVSAADMSEVSSIAGSLRHRVVDCIMRSSNFNSSNIKNLYQMMEVKVKSACSICNG